MMNVALTSTLGARKRVGLRRLLAKHQRWFVPAVLLLPMLLLLGTFFIYPVGNILVLSLVDRMGAPTLDQYVRILNNSVYLTVLLETVRVSAITTLVCLIAAYPVAYRISQAGATGRSSNLYFWVLLPFWTSILVRTFSWIIILGRNGLVNDVLLTLGITSAPLELMYNAVSVVIGMVHAQLPLAILTLVPVLEKIDPNLQKAASTLGAERGSSFWRVYFPLSVPGVASAGLLVFISSLGFFVTPALLGGPSNAMVGQLIIEQVQELVNWRFAGALAAFLIFTTLVSFLLYDRAFGISSLTNTERPASSRAAPRFSGGGKVVQLASSLSDAVIVSLRHFRVGRWIVSACGTYVPLSIVVFLTFPILLLIPVSFSRGAFIEWPPELFSTQWYEAVSASVQWKSAAMRSVIVGLATATVCLVIGTLAAFAITRHRIWGGSVVLALMLAPMIVPRIITAVGEFYLFAQMKLVGTTVGLVVGHSVLALPYVVVSVMSVLRTVDRRLEHAARVMGAGHVSTLRYITLPLIRSGLIAAFLLAFVTSFDELTVALFVTGGLFGTLPKQMWDDALLKVSPELAAVSVLVLAVVTVLMFLSERLSQRRLR